MKTIVVYSNLNHFVSVVSKFKMPYVWADMLKEETESKLEPIDLLSPLPYTYPSKKWSSFFEARSEEKRLLEGKGIITRHSAKEVTKHLLSLSPAKKKDIYVVFDFNHGMKYGEILKKAGFKGIFAQKWAFDLERERDKASAMVKKYYPDVKTPREVKFGTGSADKIMEFVEKEKESVWVVKPNGDGMWVYCPPSEDGPIACEQVISHVESNKSAIDAIPMILQEKIIGVEINIETDYSEGIPIFSMIDLENKFHHVEELGHQVGCAFDIVFPVPLDSKIRQVCNAPFDALAKKMKFTGLMDMNAIISYKDGKPYFLEYCPNRFGYNALFTEMELYGKTPDYYLTDLIEGKTKMPEGVFAAGIRLFNEDHSKDYYDSIFTPGYKNVEVEIENGLDSIWFFDVYKEKGHFKLAHMTSDALIVTAKSDTPEGAVELAKHKADRDIRFDGKFFRCDIDEYDRSYNPVFRYKFLRDRRWLEPEVKENK